MKIIISSYIVIIIIVIIGISISIIDTAQHLNAKTKQQKKVCEYTRCFSYLHWFHFFGDVLSLSFLVAAIGLCDFCSTPPPHPPLPFQQFCTDTFLTWKCGYVSFHRNRDLLPVTTLSFFLFFFWVAHTWLLVGTYL
ncbi:hypothetical protein GYMLUDRAFT_419367 [Collybiopsis luxurians FD-317 M1]|uniref:Uncharacterized protein n=1 Tax=Collybiopsis luxurians FD-317 M1 TaxID=944289 RepID=A0A0D0AKM4_9AGAR|nr:hypothetical protein GYMLUDRAFT_419367 [Collybiopsis luxurians FD-317 M1]